MGDAVSRNFEYLAYGLITVWGVVVLYVLTLVARDKKLRQQLETVQRMLEEKK
jgi:hypothetical protein